MELTEKEALFGQLDDALARFEREHPRAASVVRLRYFVGLSNDEAAAKLGVGSATVKRDFAFARAWLARELGK